MWARPVWPRGSHGLFVQRLPAGDKFDGCYGHCHPGAAPGWRGRLQGPGTCVLGLSFIQIQIMFLCIKNHPSSSSSIIHPSSSITSAWLEGSTWLEGRTWLEDRTGHGSRDLVVNAPLEFRSKFIDHSEFGFKVIAHSPDCKQYCRIQFFKRDLKNTSGAWNLNVEINL